MEVYDQAGRFLQRSVLEKNNEKITLSSGKFPSGVYFVRIVSKDLTVVKKIIIIRH